jgi:hypothetical protein
MAVAPVASGAPGERPAGPETIAPVDNAGWQQAARQALEAWQVAVTTEEKLAALETLARLSAEHPLVLAPLKGDLATAEAPVRARLLETMGRAGLAEVSEAARRALLEPDAALAATAAAVLGRSAPAGVRDDLITVWKQTPPASSVVEAVIEALARAVPAAELAALKDHSHPEIRRAALEALRRQGASACAEFLSLPELADAAAVAIYDDRMEGAWAALVEAGLGDDSPLSAPGRDRAIAAVWHQGGTAGAERLAAWLAAQPLPAAGAMPDPSARAAWRALLTWDAPPTDDPVVAARPFRARPRPFAQAWGALGRHTSTLEAWADPLGSKATAEWKAWQARLAQVPRAIKELAAFLNEASHPEGERLHHFRARLAGPADPSVLMELATAGLAAPDAPALRSEARAWLFHRHGPGAVPWLLQSLADASPAEKQAAIRLLDQHRSPEGDAYLLRLLGQARLGLVDPAVIPEVVAAVERRTRAEGTESRALRAALDAWRASQSPSLGDPLRLWRPALQPGDAEAGHGLFFSDVTRCASCHRPAPASAARAPSLDGIAGRLDSPELLEAVVLPDDPMARRQPRPEDGGCRPAGTLLTLRELRDLLTYLRSLP